jgi:hypothetical protein
VGGGVEWTDMLGLSVSLLAGGAARFPQLLPGPSTKHQDLRSKMAFSDFVPPPAGWLESPAVSAMQEPIPDWNKNHLSHLSGFYSN